MPNQTLHMIHCGRPTIRLRDTSAVVAFECRQLRNGRAVGAAGTAGSHYQERKAAAVGGETVPGCLGVYPVPLGGMGYRSVVRTWLFVQTKFVYQGCRIL
jgi:hypothetical protein